MLDMAMPGQKISITPEERARRSERAKSLHAQGRFGGPGRGQGRPRIRKATEILAEAAGKHAQDMKQVLIDCMKEGNPPSVRMRAVEMLANFEQKQAEQDAKTQESLGGLSTAALLEKLMPLFVRVLASGQISMEDLSEMVSRARKERRPVEPAPVVHEIEVTRVSG